MNCDLRAAVQAIQHLTAPLELHDLPWEIEQSEDDENGERSAMKTRQNM